MAILDKLTHAFSQTDSNHIGQAVEESVSQAIMQRRRHERRWYDNNFFDDGYHFRTISRKTGQIIDHPYTNKAYVERAIPRASRQIRGVANLLFAAEPYPVIYPQRVTLEDFLDPQTGQVDQQRYQQAVDNAKHIARKQGVWLSTTWEDMNLELQLLDLVLLAAKNSISFLQIYSDPDTQKICSQVCDAFDLILFGDRREIQVLPFITKAQPMDIKDVAVNPLFDPAMVKKLSPDNRYATSEIKDIYMRSRFGSKKGEEGESSIIIKETFMKEILTKDNWKESIKKDVGGAMDGKSQGDTVMRHVFSAAGITLRDEVIDYDTYPFADVRFEPGPLYQVPFIERFIPQNKSTDVIITRLEKWINSMIVGVYQKRKGENFQVSNFPGGQMVEYETTPLTQMNTASVGQTPFAVINLLDKYIEEQGASTAALGQLPGDVKSGVAIESLKSTEYANLKTPTLMLQQTIKTIAELMLERAHKDFLEPQEVNYMEDSNPHYFDVIGQKGYDLSRQVNKPLPAGIIPISKDSKVRIEIEPGLGLTMQGQKQAMQTIIQELTPLAQDGLLPPQALQILIKKFIETYGFGSTQEFVEAMEQGLTQGNMTDNDIAKMKIALVQGLQDTGVVGPQAEQKLVDSTKLGTLQTLKESGVLDTLHKDESQQQTNQDQIDDMVKIYQYAPPDVRRNIEIKLGLPPSTQEVISPSVADSATKISSVMKDKHEIDHPPQGGKGGAKTTKTP